MITTFTASKEVYSKALSIFLASGYIVFHAQASAYKNDSISSIYCLLSSHPI
jgi:hypothetical protein